MIVCQCDGVFVCLCDCVFVCLCVCVCLCVRAFVPALDAAPQFSRKRLLEVASGSFSGFRGLPHLTVCVSLLVCYSVTVLVC